MADTVQFDVGGRVFKVSRALINAIPDSMLARMISETWEKEPGKPMFIDRDGDKFAHVLDYLRYGSIELPVTVTQAMFQRELDYYSIPAVDGSVTQVQKKTLVQVKGEVNTNYNLFKLAEECYNRFCQRLCQGHSSIDIELGKDDGELYVHFGRSKWPEGLIKQLNDYLDLFGLHASVWHSICRGQPGNILLSVSVNK
jgi:hypothetical protein